MRRAVIVAINQYQQRPLAGCINDAFAVAGLLGGYYGFSSRDIELLLDKDATNQAIKQAIKWLVEKTQPGDHAFIHYSGHGVQLPGRLGGEWDGLDECLVPVDFDFARQNAIRDDDLQDMLSGLADGAHLWMTADCCHSETLTRESGWGSLLQTLKLAQRSIVQARTLPYSVDALWLRNIVRQQMANFNPFGFRRAAKQLTNVALLSACESGENAADTVIDGKPTGLFTYWLVKTLERPENRGISLTQLADILRKKCGNAQHPRADGPIDMLGASLLA